MYFRKTETYDREIGALDKFLSANPDYTGMLITENTERTILSKSGEIKVVPVWKWLLEQESV